MGAVVFLFVAQLLGNHVNLEVLCKIRRFLRTANADNPRLGPSFLGSVRWSEITIVRELRAEHQGAMKHQGAVYHLVSRGNKRERLLPFAARIGRGVLKALAMPSSVRRETSADCRAQTVRVIAKWAHEAGNPKYEGLTLIERSIRLRHCPSLRPQTSAYGCQASDLLEALQSLVSVALVSQSH